MTLKWHGYGVLALAIVSGPSPVHAQKMYWSSSAGIVCANLDGSEVEVVFSEFSGVRGIAIDSVHGKIFWTSASTDTIHRANLDGSLIERLITTGLDQPWGIALDLVRGKMYWANRLALRIQRANLDGTGVEDVVVTEPGPTAIGLDLEAGKVYWTISFLGGIRRANLDGTEVEDVIINPPLPNVVSIALDLTNDKIYYTLAELTFFFLPGRIQRANLDGTGVEDIISSGVPVPAEIALDVPGGKMYWTDILGGKIRRANLDGSDPEDLLAVGAVGALALDLAQAAAIPALSVWGLVVMSLLLVTMARVFSLRRLRSVGTR